METTSAPESQLDDLRNILTKGPSEWNTYRKNNPGMHIDLSIVPNIREIFLNNAWQDYITCVSEVASPTSTKRQNVYANFRGCRLSGLDLRSMHFRHIDFRAADLSDTQLQDSTFFQCYFGPQDNEVKSSRSQPVPTPVSAVFSGVSGPNVDAEIAVTGPCRLHHAFLFGTTFSQCTLGLVVLTEAYVDDTTDIRVNGLAGTVLSRDLLEAIDVRRRPSASRLREATVVDSIADFKMMFSGFFAWFNAIQVLAFFLPYVVFLASQYVRHSFDGLLYGGEQTTIIANFIRFFVSAGREWRVIEPSLWCIPSVLLLLFNSLRFILLLRVQYIEHRASVKGFYDTTRVGPCWMNAFHAYRFLIPFSILFVILHLIGFVTIRVPHDLRAPTLQSTSHDIP